MNTAAQQAIAMRELAKSYLAYGFNIVPLGGDKRPVITGVGNGGQLLRFRWEDWQTTKQTGTLLTQIMKPAWWADVRGIAGVCGAISGHMACIDFDDTNADLPVRFLAALGLPTDYPWCVVTPGGGWHVWVRCADLALDKGKIDRPAVQGDGHIEIRHNGHYAALPGSLHSSGGVYAWMHSAPTEHPTAVNAATLLAAYDSVTSQEQPKAVTTVTTPTSTFHESNHYAQAALNSEIAAVLAAQTGARNNTLNTAAYSLGQLVGGWLLETTQVEAALLSAAMQIGLGENEARTTIHSGLDAGRLQPRTLPVNGNAPNGNMAPVYNGFGATPDPDTLALTEETQAEHRSWPYAVKDGRLCYCWLNRDDEVERKPIADFYASIEEEITDEDGSKIFVISGRSLRAGAFSLEVPAEIFGDERRLKSLLDAAVGARDPIYKGMSGHLSAAIKLLTNSDSPSFKRFQRTGWAQQRFLLPGRPQHNQRIDLPHKLPFHAAGDDAELDQAIIALDALLTCIPTELSTPVLAMLLQAPLHRRINLANEKYAIFIQGRTGSLKTSWAQVAMCIYGAGFADESLLLKWGEGATRNAIMNIATHAADMPMMVDNYKPNTGNGKDDFVNLIHTIIEGGEKLRLTRSSTLKDPKPIHCFPLFTGEDLPTTDAAALARVLAVQFAWQAGDINNQLSVAQRLSHHLALIGSLWIEWLEEHSAFDLMDRFEERRAAWAAVLQKNKPDMPNILRIASNLATNELTWQVALEHPVLGPLLAPHSAAHLAGLHQIAINMATSTVEASEAQQFMAALRELLATGQYRLQPRGAELTDWDRDRVLGWHDDAGVYLLPALALSAVKKLLGAQALPGSAQSLYSQMAGLQWIATTGEGHTARVIRIGTTTQRVLHLHWHALKQNAEDSESIIVELGL